MECPGYGGEVRVLMINIKAFQEHSEESCWNSGIHYGESCIEYRNHRQGRLLILPIFYLKWVMTFIARKCHMYWGKSVTEHGMFCMVE